MTPRRTQARLALLLAYVAFISLGLPDGLLGVAWPSIRQEFSQPLEALGVLLAALTSGYLLSSFLSGRVMARLGVGWLLAVSCLATGASLLGYTLAPAWGWIVALVVLAGLGAGAIDAGINTFIASEHHEDQMQWLHASFGIGVTLGPVIMTAGLALFDSWRWGYVVVAGVQLFLAACFGLTRSLWQREPVAQEPAHEAEAQHHLLDYHTALRETLRRPQVWLSIVLFFVYTGLELTLGHWAYTLLVEARGIAPDVAGLWAGSYWGSFTLGRILAGWYTRRVRIDTLLRLSMLAALVGACLLWLNPSQGISLAGVAIIGFAVAPIFPGLVSTTVARVGTRHAANTIGMQISAAGLGGALVPGLAGVVAAATTLEAIPAYLVVLSGALLGLYLISSKFSKF